MSDTASKLDSLPLGDHRLLREDLFIAREWCAGSGGGRTDVINPATREVLASVADATRKDVRRAIDAAQTAFRDWSRRTAYERAATLRAWHDLIVENADDLATILTAEQGKPFAEARGEILYGATFVEWSAEEAKRVYGETIPAGAPGRRIVVLREPVGVCGAITPWNFPSAMITRKAAPALAAGCTVVLKPASETPLSALALAELADRAGFPAGVFNVVHGPPELVGEELTSSSTVRVLSFTGSTAVGRQLMAQSAPTVKRLALELGGNAPFIVFDDADVGAAVKGAIDSKFRASGQTCVCANRILVQSGVHDEFAERLAAATKDLVVGDGFEPGVAQGPLIHEAAVAKVQAHIADAVERGATVLAGGDRHELGGSFFQPTVIAGARPDMLLADEETFGPVAPVFEFATEEDAIELANATEFGLAAYVFSRSSARIWRVTEALEFGIVAVNTGIFSFAAAPFGGVKQSGLGREGSRHGLDEFLELKYVCLDGLDADR
jgi:succinate-semialdehyde dehydrogenase / glutarate-semialdehyde dehydrogenase